MTDNYRAGLEYLGQYDTVNGYEFYKDIFPDNENSDEKHLDFSHPNALYLYRDDAYNAEHPERVLRRRVMYNDTWEQDYVDYVEGNPFTLCSGLVYRRNTNTIRNAQRMNAMIFDLDGVGEREYLNLFHRFGVNDRNVLIMPMPTYVVLSGNGVHIYYVFTEPVDLYPNLKPLLKKLKYHLTGRLWDYKSTSQLKQIQRQPISQGFRMVGSINEKYDVEIKGYRTGERISFEKLNSFAREPFRVNLDWKPSPDSAPKRYPKKWAGGVKNGDKLYLWWLNKSADPEIVKAGHRYYYMLCLSYYACKCCIPYDRLKADMYTVLDRLKDIEHVNELTEYDVKNALKAYKKDIYNFTIDDIEQLTEIRIDKNKRNGRKQAEHIKLMNYVRDEINGNKNWQGRPSAAATVENYRRDNPDSRKADCIRDTGLSKKTVYKWWDGGSGTVAQSTENVKQRGTA